MSSATLKSLIDSPELREVVAAAQHEIWSHWMCYLFEQSQYLPSRDYAIPRFMADNWKRQTETSYDKLSDKERESDREQADKVLKTISAFIIREVLDRPGSMEDAIVEGVEIGKQKCYSSLWIKIDQCDNAFLGVFTDQEKQHEDETNPPSDTGHYWDGPY